MSKIVEITEHNANCWTLNINASLFWSDHECKMELIDTNKDNSNYTFEIVNFCAQSVKIVIPFVEAHAEGTVDPAKVLLWLLKKMKEALCPSCH